VQSARQSSSAHLKRSSCSELTEKLKQLSKKFDVICIGAAIVDIPLQPVNRSIFDVASYPIDRIAMSIGGDAINEATIISRLGHKTALLSKIGDDIAGQFILDNCKKNNIQIDDLKIDKNTDTSINVGLVTDDGERTFVTNRNGSLWKLSLDDIDLKEVGNTRVLSLASIFNSPLLDGKALETIFKEAKKYDVVICADVVHPRLNETLDDISDALGYIDYFFPNYEEASLLTGETDLDKIADKFLDCGVKNVIIKTGKDGCFIKNKEKAFTVPAVQGIKAIDTIGAGDNFASGFISAVLEGKGLYDCARFANATASISVQSVGATTGVQSREQVEKRFQAYKGE
jgi:sugar/nucleoside kinase (ribokinase family)